MNVLPPLLPTLASHHGRQLQTADSNSRQPSALMVSGGRVTVDAGVFDGNHRSSESVESYTFFNRSRAVTVIGGVLEVVQTTFRNYQGMDRGGAMLIEGGEVEIRDGATFEDNQALVEGGAVAIYGGTLELSNGTALRNNVAPFGQSIYISNPGTLDYLLPTPIAHWVNAAQSGELEGIAQLMAGAVDGDFPFPCAPGLFASTTRPEVQSSPACQGPCPPGDFCAAATVVPQQCPLGNFCTQGSPAPFLCPKGTRGANVGLKLESECVNCAAGFRCEQGQTNQTKCAPGEFSGKERSDSCTACAIGTFQPEAGQTSCIDCPAGTPPHTHTHLTPTHLHSI